MIRGVDIGGAILNLGRGAKVGSLDTHRWTILAVAIRPWGGRQRREQHVVSLEIAVDDHILVEEVQAAQ